MTTSEFADDTAGRAPEGSARARAAERPVDVLIVTALQDELEAVLALGEGGRARWEERKDNDGFPYHRREFPRALDRDGTGTLVVAAAWLGKMGRLVAAIRGGKLLGELNPACVGMCGICAGMRGEVALGDVIIADKLYSYDEGKVVAKPGKEPEILHEIKTYDLHPLWTMNAANLEREIDREALQRHRPPSKEAQRRWLLHEQYAFESEGGPAPATNPDQERAFPDWTELVDEAVEQNLLALKAGVLSLTDAGRERVLNERTRYRKKLPRDPDLRVVVGTVGTGSVVQKDPKLFERLRSVMRSTVGVEMEGAAIGELAERFEKRGIVVKAVSDHGDLQKDDSFRKFACRASAEVLLAFLLKHVEPAVAADEDDDDLIDEGDDEDGGHDRHGVRGARDQHGVRRSRKERANGFLERVAHVAAVREGAGAVITKHRAPPPFAGLLEVEVRGGAVTDKRVIGALEQPINEGVVAQYASEVTRRYRTENPYLSSTLVHVGEQAPRELVDTAWRQGVVLKSFAAYQGIIDFKGYLDKQTSRLEADTVYPPWLYVEQPARWSLAGGREEQKTERALSTLWEMLDAPHPRFALVLGDFGAGKTFLLHELARRMRKDGHSVVPVLVEMSRLEKQRSLRALLAQHFALADEGRIDLDAFEYMLAAGRIALLFDGFDELALRLTYDRALEHFETVIAAAQGNAKVVITSRTQHFLTDHQIRRALAEKAEQAPGYRLFQLDKFGEPQIRQFLKNMIPAPDEAEERYQLLHEVKDLLGLSENPRMLGFIAKIEPEKLREAKEKTGEITAAKLYELLITKWLIFEWKRINPPGAPKGIAFEKLGELVTALAGVFWERNAKSLALDEFSGILVTDGLDPKVVEFMIGSGSLLVRDEDGRFSFVHRSVMEWLVVDVVARELKEKGDAAHLSADEMSELMAEFLLSLAGREAAEAWATRTLQGTSDGYAKKNALRIVRRASTKEQAEEAVVIDDAEIELVTGLNLAGQDLRGRNLSGSDLRKANLNGADLRSATLVGAKLGGASLVGAKLAHANLEKADVTGVNLAGADLSFARLVAADLRGVAHQNEANVRGAMLVGAKGVTLDAAALAVVGAAPPSPRECTPMWMPASPCNTVAWSPSSDLVASGHDDGSVRVCDAVSGQAIRTIYGHLGPIHGVAFSPDGRMVASASQDNTLRLWDVSFSSLLRVFEGHTNYVWSVAFSPDGKTLASASQDNTLRLWDISTGRSLRTFQGHTHAVFRVVYSPDGKTLASASEDNTLRLWDVSTAHELRVFEGHTSYVWSVAFSPDGSSLASASEDGMLRLWDVGTARCLRAFQGHTHAVWGVAFSPDSDMLASASLDHTLRLWDVATARELRSFQGHADYVVGLAFSPDGKVLASASEDNTLRLWDVATTGELRAFQGHVDWIRSVAFSPDGKTLASGSKDNTVRLWDFATARELRVFRGHFDSVYSVAFSPDGKTLASTSWDTSVRLWDLATGRELCAFRGHTNYVTSVAFSPDGKLLVSASHDTTVRLWDLKLGRELAVFTGHTSYVTGIAFSPDSRTLASVSRDATVRLWDIATARELLVFNGHSNYVYGVAFSPDGKTVASASRDGTVRLWDIATARELLVFKGHTNYVYGVAFSPDGKTLASASWDHTVRLWDIATARSLHAFEGHTNSLRSVVFSFDGKSLASASDDGTVRLWDIATARCLAILLSAPEGWVAFTPDGRYKLGGDIAGSFWHVIGLCRFEPGELDPYLPHLRVPDDAPLFAIP